MLYVRHRCPAPGRKVVILPIVTSRIARCAQEGQLREDVTRDGAPMRSVRCRLLLAIAFWLLLTVIEVWERCMLLRIRCIAFVGVRWGHRRSEALSASCLAGAFPGRQVRSCWLAWINREEQTVQQSVLCWQKIASNKIRRLTTVSKCTCARAVHPDKRNKFPISGDP